NTVSASSFCPIGSGFPKEEALARMTPLDVPSGRFRPDAKRSAHRPCAAASRTIVQLLLPLPPTQREAIGALPANYRRLNLTDEQVKNLYKLRTDYRARIAEMEKQIAKLKDEEKEAMEKVLTAEQQKKLRELKTGERVPGK